MIDLAAPIEAWMPVVWYPGYLPDLPDLCVGRWPAVFRRPAGPDSYKIWYVETPAERQALLDALAQPVPRKGGALDFRSGPDRATLMPGRLGPVIALYPPPDAGWPWIAVTAIRGAPASMGLGRGIYAYDIFDTEAAALDHMARLRAMAPDAPVRTPADVLKS